MRAKTLLPMLIIILLGITAAASTTANNSIINSTQLQSYAQKIPAPPSNLFQEILNYVAQAYNWLVGIIQNILQSTLLKQDPGLASTYANIIAWLIPLTAIYILLVFAEVAKKILGYILVAGWLFLIVVLFLAH
ncbi:hypothetical protein SULI_07950 [Saccharolobus solfataricus]|uniref:Uncharacterized protein n=2 Tax=Saccharolobus solfataricus TaxID=2287 RepID=A0A0E3GV18_SACSO|nr:hypothetical protein [Saccharolobus solfataricus]AKA73848.1 hypothetical protein SULB_1590 [Saccharolobus solfataricus]AKA76546.1 hypothetical protein SULC_1588 [Saccharolobus solfataricus]AKA79239.1 hypothetical protein SULA_1589 [Saccharolobus solfataricus]AZF68328.1 hypothetical protein SULG_07950 [Saccharolobus solfataricus]AZF70948.1 hypothetical protein SULH_07950 [Saccharolobus solfataricus]